MPDYEWRITKYNPAQRSETGSFTGTTWSSVWDIGESFEDELTVEEYLRVETAYADVATSLAVESNAYQLHISELESFDDSQDELAKLGLPKISRKLPKQDSVVSVTEIGDLVRIALRELAWFKIQTHSFFIHFGRDFYMYAGSDVPCERSRKLARSRGLFVEDFTSPYA
ncbi:hypothetical protein SAMN05421837_1011213 [Amycolatopsis pretoriensis]|uniref:Uncharacterized protein n=1 Tax=Amycolatopsis pretoriensis TaxID=218821 RepID=A0A1H5Q9X1_9PSEU|nr:hypothetical protein [Amycolatopsis pretoriensis]SEF22047.1 hypothetical protein SAMN05421837_1011213 [Amycolatopsis pretoriensis]